MSWDDRLVMSPDYRHPVTHYDGKRVAELIEEYRDTQDSGIHTLIKGRDDLRPIRSLAKISAYGFDRLEAWMRWKSTKTLRERLTEQLAKAEKRGSRGTTVPVGDLRELLALIQQGGEPK